MKNIVYSEKNNEITFANKRNKAKIVLLIEAKPAKQAHRIFNNSEKQKKNHFALFVVCIYVKMG